MHKVAIFTLSILAFPVVSMAEESSIQVFNKGYDRQRRVEKGSGHFDVYDKSSNRVGHIRDNKIYNNKWGHIGTIEKGGDSRSNRGNR